VVEPFIDGIDGSTRWWWRGPGCLPGTERGARRQRRAVRRLQIHREAVEDVQDAHCDPLFSFGFGLETQAHSHRPHIRVRLISSLEVLESLHVSNFMHADR
jgi:hypothetical protein